MRVRRIILAALGAMFVMGAAVPAFADEDGWRRHEWREHAWRRHMWREHEWREHEWREHHRWYAPPPYYGSYYAPPPVYYSSPGLGFGLTIR
jgi:hypothetical protein